MKRTFQEENVGVATGSKGSTRKRPKSEANGTTKAAGQEIGENGTEDTPLSITSDGGHNDIIHSEETLNDQKMKSLSKRSDRMEARGSGREKASDSVKVDPSSVQARMINKALGVRKGPAKEKKLLGQEAVDKTENIELTTVGSQCNVKKENLQKPVEPPRRVQKNPNFLQEHRTRYVDQKMGRAENRKVKFIHGNYDSYYNYRNPGPNLSGCRCSCPPPPPHPRPTLPAESKHVSPRICNARPRAARGT